MPGFRHCNWCDGKGCMCCDSERARWEKGQAKEAEAKAARTPDQIRQSIADLTWLRDGGDQGQVGIATVITAAMYGRDSFDRDKLSREIEAEEAALAAALDAEYGRQFPGGLKPIFTARLDSASDIALLKQAFGRESIEHAFGPDGGGVVEIEGKAGAARATQALRDYAYAEGE